jgi:hypothetical protein
VPCYGWACLPIPWCSRLVNVLAIVVRRENARNSSSLSGLCRLCRVASHRLFVGIFSSKGWMSHAPFRVMSVMDRLACYLTASCGSVCWYASSALIHGEWGIALFGW